MKTLELEKFIQNLSPDLYSFAYILIPDDLQASQLMIDTVQSFIIQKKSLIDKWTSSTEKEAYFQDIKIHLYRAMFDLSKKRFTQLKMSFKDVEDSTGFFALEFDEKAVLFLQEKSDYSLELIEFILGKTRAEVMALLYSARIKMVSNLPSNHEQNHVRNHN